MSRSPRRRAAVTVLVAFALVALVTVAALAVDYGYLLVVRNQLQTAVDAAALAGAAELIDEAALTGQADPNALIVAAHQTARQYAARHEAGGQTVVLLANEPNDPTGDVVVGYLDDPSDLTAPLAVAGDTAPNAVQVTARRTASRGNPVGLFLARVVGLDTADVTASATASIRSDIRGFRVTAQSGNAMLLPFALWVEYWDSVVHGSAGSDQYRYDPATGQVSSGTDGIKELVLYPLDLFGGGGGKKGGGGGGAGDPPPSGNFGTVDIGNPNNSTADIARQILYGVSADDLDWHGGQLAFGPDGTLTLQGDTGVSAGIKDELESIIGQTRTICLYQTVSGTGNNAEYLIVRFVGVRLLDVVMTGPLASRKVVIQPAVVSDPTALTGAQEGQSEFIYTPVTLVR